MSRAGEPDGPGFRREIGLFSATMLVMGAMVGSGIFIVSTDIAKQVVGSGWLLAVWALTGVMTVLGALVFAELSGMMPDAGGQYVYLKRAFGDKWGFLYGWTFFAVIQTGSIAAVAVAFMKFLGVFVPLLGTDTALDKETGKSPAMVLYRWPAPGVAADVAAQEADEKAGKLWISRGDQMTLRLPLPLADKPVAVFERGVAKPFTITLGQCLAAALIVGLTLLNCLGVREGKLVQNVFTVAKIAGLALVIAVGLLAAPDAGVVKANAAEPWAGIETGSTYAEAKAVFPTAAPWLLVAMAVAGAMVGSLFSADAWNNVAFAGGEVKEPHRTLPRALTLGVAAVIGLYLLVNLAYLAVLPIQGAADGADAVARGVANAKDDRVATAVLERAGERWGLDARWGAGLMAACVMASTFGCVNGMILMGARLYYVMARDGLFFRAAGNLNGAGVPAASLLMQAGWSALLVFSGAYNELLDCVMFSAVLFYALATVGLFVLRWKEPATPRPVRVPLYPLVPLLYLLFCLAFMAAVLVTKPQYTWPGMALVLLGLPLYGWWDLARRRRAARD